MADAAAAKLAALAVDPRFAAFQRHDAYGPWGLKPQPVSERLRLALFTVAVAPVRFFATLVFVVATNLVCRVSGFLPLSVAARGDFVRRWGSYFCGLCLWSLGFRIRYVREPGASHIDGGKPVRGQEGWMRRGGPTRLGTRRLSVAMRLAPACRP